MDRFDMERFVGAQNDGGTYGQALAELRSGQKVTHWMWFVFPQIAGLGRSSMARKYAISSLDEAREYLRHPVLGPRLVESAQALTLLEGRSASRVLGDIDAQKLQSSMTLFQRADPDNEVFQHVLEQYFDGESDDATDKILGASD